MHGPKSALIPPHRVPQLVLIDTAPTRAMTTRLGAEVLPLRLHVVRGTRKTAGELKHKLHAKTAIYTMPSGNVLYVTENHKTNSALTTCTKPRLLSL